MEKIKRFMQGFNVAFAGILATLSPLLDEHLQRLIGNRGLSYAALFAIGSVFLFIADFSISQLVERSKVLRRLIAGNKWKEGWWYDVTRVGPEKSLDHVTVMEIRFEDGELLISGQGYDTKAQHLCHWQSEQCVLNGSRLVCEYRSQTIHPKIHGNDEVGIIKMTFGNPANDYTCFYRDSTGAMEHVVTGFRVDDQTLSASGDFSTADSKTQFVKKVLAQELQALQRS